MPPEPTSHELTRTDGIPRKWALVVWAVAALVLLVAVPYGLSWLGARHGWGEETGPSWLNLAGISLVLAGFALLVWTFVTVFEVAEERVPYDLGPPDLVTYDAYGFVRHPMYLAVVLTWLGWSVVYGNWTVFIVTFAIAAYFEFVLVPEEERALEKRHQGAYRRYKDDIPRWVPK